MKIQFHRIDTNVVVGLLVREFCCSGTDVSAKVLAMYADTRTPSMEPQWLATGLSQGKIFYFQPGHEEYPVYYIPEVQKIIKNAVYWCKPSVRKTSPLDCAEVKEVTLP